MNSKKQTTGTKKDGKLSLVPKLRFPEFREAETWDADALGEVATFVNEKIPLERVAVENYVSTENILPDYGGVAKASKLPTTGAVTRYRPNDTLVSNIRPYLKKVWVADKEGGASNDVIVIRAKERLLPRYFSCLLKNDAFVAYVMTGAKGVKMPRGDVGSMKAYPTLYPSKAEQQKIATCLSSVDEVIAAQARKVDALKTHKKGLMQQLFPREGETQPRLRFPEFQNDGEWEPRELSDFITERDEYPKEKVPLFSLTIEDGVTPKTERYERSFLVNDEASAYKLVMPNDFAFNPMNLRFGAIGRHSGTEKVAVSKYYNIFSCDETVDSRFCETYFRSDGMVAFYDDMAIGSLIEKRRVHFAAFLKFNIRFPRLLEQQRIASCLSSLDALITAETQKLEALKRHKRGLMQQLFPSPEEAEA
jgi:type I restriction enzyme S subunit